MKITAILAVCFCFNVQDDEQTELKDEISKAIEKLAEQKNYSLKSESTSEGGAAQWGNAARGAVTGVFNQEDLLYVIQGSEQKISKSGTVLYKKGKEWLTEDEINDAEEESGGGNRWGRGWNRRTIKNVKIPHVEIGGIPEKMERIRKLKKKMVGGQPCQGYMSNLPKDTAKELSGSADWNRGEVTGSIKIWISKKGMVVGYEVKTTSSWEWQGNSGETTTTRTVTLTKFGRSQAKIPREAAVKLQ